MNIKLKSLREALKPMKESLQQEETEKKRLQKKVAEQERQQKERLQKKVAEQERQQKERLQKKATEASRRNAVAARQVTERVQRELEAAKTRAKTRRADETKAAEAAKLKLAEQRAAKENIEEEEFRQLVEEMSPHGFTHSSQVSDYIRRNKLRRKYKHISGILEMELDGNIWDFKGGFPPKIFAKLCDKLGLKSQGSKATPGKFTSYKDIQGSSENGF